MAGYALLALLAPLPGHEEAYLAWHEHTHVPEVLRVPGFLRATRYEATPPFSGDGRWSLMAIYDIETDDIEACLEELKARLKDGRVSSSPLGDPERRLLTSWRLLSRHAAPA